MCRCMAAMAIYFLCFGAELSIVGECTGLFVATGRIMFHVKHAKKEPSDFAWLLAIMAFSLSVSSSLGI